MQLELWVAAPDVLPAVVDAQHDAVAQPPATGHCALQGTAQPPHSAALRGVTTPAIGWSLKFDPLRCRNLSLQCQLDKEKVDAGMKV